MLGDIWDTIQDAFGDAIDPRMFLAVLFVLVAISLYLGFGLPGSRQLKRFVGVQPRQPVGSGSGSSSG